MNIKKIIAAALLILVICVPLCGFTLAKKAVAVDTEQNRVYRYITADKVLSEFAWDEKTAADKYKNSYVLLSGQVTAIGQKGESITLKGADASGTVVCRCGKELLFDVKGHVLGDKVAVYGKLTLDPLNKGIQVSAEKITSAPENVRSAEMYYTADGSSFDYSAAAVRTLADGRVTYRIPAQWKDIEVNIKDSDLGIIDGYQYVLNKTSGGGNVPESLFVCYFDKELLNERDDIKKTDLTEKAIIENIEGSVGSFPSRREETTYYGAKYQYYIGNYKDPAEIGKGYRTEYVFRTDGDRGIVMFLYLYREKRHISDVMFVTRFLEVK